MVNNIAQIFCSFWHLKRFKQRSFIKKSFEVPQSIIKRTTASIFTFADLLVRLAACIWNLGFWLIKVLYLINLQKQLSRGFLEKRCFKNFAKFTGKHPCQSVFFNKVAGLGLELYQKKRLWHRCFLVNFAKILTTLFLKNTMMAAWVTSPRISNFLRLKDYDTAGGLNFKVRSYFRSSHRRCSVRTGVLRNFIKSTGKLLCKSLLFKNANLQLSSNSKKN